MERSPRLPRQQLKELSSTTRNKFLKIYNEKHIQLGENARRAYDEIKQRPSDAKFSMKTTNNVNKIVQQYELLVQPTKRKRSAQNSQPRKRQTTQTSCPRRPNNLLNLTQGSFEYIVNNQKRQIPIEYLMFLDTLHDILEGDRANNIKSQVKNKFRRRDNKYIQFGNVILKPSSSASDGTYIGYMKYIVNPFMSGNAVVQSLTESVPAMLKDINTKTPKVYREPTIKDLKKHMLQFVSLLIKSKYGNVYSTFMKLQQDELQEFVKVNDINFSIDAVKYSIYSPTGIMNTRIPLNIKANNVVTAAQIFDSANTSLDKNGLVLIKPCVDDNSILNNPYNIRGTFVSNYQGSIMQIGNRFDMFVLTPQYFKGISFKSNILYPIDICIFVAVRVPLRARTNKLNKLVQSTIFIKEVVISTQLQLSKSLQYNENTGVCYLRRLRGPSLGELQTMLLNQTSRYKTLNKDVYKILSNIVFDWKRQQDSFQMVFSKMLNGSGMTHFVVTHDFLAFAFGVYYGTNVILQDKGLYYIFENIGVVSRNNINSTHKALSMLVSSLDKQSDGNDHKMNTLMNAAMFQMVSNGLKPSPLERRALTNVQSRKNNIISTINERPNLTTSQKQTYRNIIHSKNDPTRATYFRSVLNQN